MLDRKHTQSQQISPWIWLGPALYMLIVGLYFVSRFGGHWAENDSAAFAQYIRVATQTGQLIPVNEPVYPNGYAFQAISVFVISLTGLDVATLQQLIYPLTAALPVFVAWALYRELIASGRTATIITLLLFTQPEFLFVLLRSSHEKFTRTLMLLCLLLLVRSFKLRDRPAAFATHVSLFYLAAYGFIASNNLLAHSFIVAIATALIIDLALSWHRQQPVADRSLALRLVYPVLVSIGLVYIVTFYAYLPAQHDLLVLQDIWQQVAVLLLDVQAHSTNAYAAVSAGWISLPVYFLVSIANWIVLISSLVIWARQGWMWLRRGQVPQPQVARLIWLLYAAIAIQGAASIVVDASGVLGSNLQHRLFPSFAIIAVVPVGVALAGWRPAPHRRALVTVGAVAFGLVAILSVLKASNEPSLSNKWAFYQPGELGALNWINAHTQNTRIWTEFDERLATAFQTRYGLPTNGNSMLQGKQSTGAKDFLISAITRLRSSRIGQALPVPPDALQVYDDGVAQLFHRRPITPFQR